MTAPGPEPADPERHLCKIRPLRGGAWEIACAYGWSAIVRGTWDEAARVAENHDHDTKPGVDDE